MEKYSPNLRLILLANSTANIIAPIRSRTLLVRVAAPSHQEICEVLAVSAKKEGWEIVKGLHERIAVESGRNLRRALLMYEAVHAQKYVGFLFYHKLMICKPANLGATARKCRKTHPFLRRTGRP
jgi:replication factor C subunit 3/5